MSTNSSYILGLPDRGKLEQEQRHVLNQAVVGATSQSPFPPVILVQGVAGSGKTTVALSVLREFLEDHAGMLLGNERISLLLVTYNLELLNSSSQRLRESLTQSPHADLCSTVNQLAESRANMMTFTEFCRVLLPPEDRKLVCTDEESVEILRGLCARRGVRLPPEQAFVYITTFFQSTQRSWTQKDIEIASRCGDLRITQGESQKLSEIAMLHHAYQKKLAGRLDRGLLGHRLLKSLLEEEKHYQIILETDAEKLFEALKKNPSLQEALRWLKRALTSYTDIPVLRLYRPLLDPVEQMLRGQRCKTEEWRNLRNFLKENVPLYGLRGTHFFENLGSTLAYPILMIDESQDLCETEIQLLVRCWFHLPRNHRSRLFFFGDFNQMITPTGFRWEDIFDIVDKIALTLHSSQPFALPAFRSFKDAQIQSGPHPCFLLLNNYRTTEEVALFAQTMMQEIVSTQVKDPQTRERILANVIDPKQTLPSQVEDEIMALSDEERIPVVLIGSPELFKRELQCFLEAQAGKLDASDTRSVVISGTEERLDIELVQKSVTVLPLLSCKGLEFSRVIILGMPISLNVSNPNAVEKDLLSQWYTGITRSSGLLMLYLTPEQMDFLQQAGWKSLKGPRDPNRVQELLRRWLPEFARTRVNQSALTRSGDSYLQEFFITKEERWLNEALIAFREAKNEVGIITARRSAADFYREEKSYENACYHYRQLGDRAASADCWIESATSTDLPTKREEAIRQAREDARQIAESEKKADTWKKLWESTSDKSDAYEAVESYCQIKSLKGWQSAVKLAESSQQQARIKEIAMEARNTEPVFSFGIFLREDPNQAIGLLDSLVRTKDVENAANCLKERTETNEGKKENELFLESLSTSDPFMAAQLAIGTKAPVETCFRYFRLLCKRVLSSFYQLGGWFSLSHDIDKWWRRGLHEWLRFSFDTKPSPKVSELQRKFPSERSMADFLDKASSSQKKETQDQIKELLREGFSLQAWRGWIDTTKQLLSPFVGRFLPDQKKPKPSSENRTPSDLYALDLESIEDFWNQANATPHEAFSLFFKGLEERYVRRDIEDLHLLFPSLLWSRSDSYWGLTEKDRKTTAIKLWHQNKPAKPPYPKNLIEGDLEKQWKKQIEEPLSNKATDQMEILLSCWASISQYAEAEAALKALCSTLAKSQRDWQDSQSLLKQLVSTVHPNSEERQSSLLSELQPLFHPDNLASASPRTNPLTFHNGLQIPYIDIESASEPDLNAWLDQAILLQSQATPADEDLLDELCDAKKYLSRQKRSAALELLRGCLKQR